MEYFYNLLRILPLNFVGPKHFLGGLFGGDTKVEAPKPRDLFKEQEQITRAMEQFGPRQQQAQFDVFSQFSPQFQQQSLANLAQATPELIGIQQENLGGLLGLTTEAQRGLRQANLDDASTIGLKSVDVFRRANPQLEGLLGALTAQAETELQAGGDLTASEKRLLEQGVRNKFAASGNLKSNPAAFSEAAAKLLSSRQARQQRQNFATNVGQLNLANRVDPFSILRGGAGAIPGAMQGLLNTGSQFGQQGRADFGGLQGQAQDIFSSNLNLAASQQAGAANRQAGLMGGLIQGGGSILSSGDNLANLGRGVRNIGGSILSGIGGGIAGLLNLF